MAKDRRYRSNIQVIAATAGKDTWKTWAGREHGTDDFELLDYFRGAHRKFCRKFLWKPPCSGTPCPICLDEPASSDQWHITSSCGHAVCIDCLRGYAASQVRDAEHYGPLKCPACPRPLRESDAIVALGSNEDLVRLWDAKIRDELLRAIPNYRNCPHCVEQDTNKGGLGGGGFVTPECLAPINEGREREAESIMKLVFMSNRLLFVAYFAYFYFYAQVHSTSFFVDLLNVFAPLAAIRRLWLLCNLSIARTARRALFKPISVQCPCCEHDFILNAETELATAINRVRDEATENWIGNNCRPCPSCSAPISKLDGCNHMKCGKCQARFCWACMRLRTNCAAFRCTNGAPYGNATASEQPVVEEIESMTLVDHIFHVESLATSLNRNDFAFAIGLFASILGRESRFVQEAAKRFVIAAACLLSGPVIMSLALAYVLVVMGQGITRQFLRTNHVREMGEGHEPRMGDLIAPLNDRVENEMIAEAIGRSLRDQ